MGGSSRKQANEKEEVMDKPINVHSSFQRFGTYRVAQYIPEGMVTVSYGDTLWWEAENEPHDGIVGFSLRSLEKDEIIEITPDE